MCIHYNHEVIGSESIAHHPDNTEEAESMRKIFLLSLLSIFLLSTYALPDIEKDAQDILNKMIEAQGGRETLEKIEDTKISGTIEMTQMGVNGTLTIYFKEPNKMRFDVEVMGMVITQAYDGETAWFTNPQTGNSEEMPEQMAVDFKRQAFGNDSLLNPEKFGITYAYKGKEAVEGKEYLMLEQTFDDGFKAMLYIDSETFLLYKTKAKTISPAGAEVEAETLMEDYIEVEGMMMPTSMTTFQDGNEFMVMTLSESTFNTGVEDSFFEMKN